MKSILIQASQSIYLDTVIETIGKSAECLIAEDSKLGDLILEKGFDISAIVIFEFTDGILNLCRLARNERFCNPLLPIAYVGYQTTVTTLPYGVKRFSANNLLTFNDYLSSSLNIKALIVEDDESIRDVLSLTLSKSLPVSTAENGNIAINMIDSNEYDVVILDVMLPGKSGEEVFAHIRKTSPRTAVVIITAFDTSDKEFIFSFNGAAAYIKKPISCNKEFRHEIVEALLRHHEAYERTQVGVTLNYRNTAQRDNEKRMSKYLL